MKVLLQSSTLPQDQQEKTLAALASLDIPEGDFGMIPFVEELVGVSQHYPYPVIFFEVLSRMSFAQKFQDCYN